MVKLCYQNNGRNTEEFYFDLQSQKVYKICLSAYYAKHKRDPVAFPLRRNLGNTFRAGIATCIITYKCQDAIAVSGNWRLGFSQ